MDEFIGNNKSAQKTDSVKRTAEIDALMKDGLNGVIDENTLRTKIARKTLEIENIPMLMNLLMFTLFSDKDTESIASVLYIMDAKITRLEDDVCRLRCELAKERVGRSDESRLTKAESDTKSDQREQSDVDTEHK